MNLLPSPASLVALEQWPAVRSLATSDWAYPLVSTLHLLGISLLLGSIATVDLRLLGAWRRQIDPATVELLRRTAALGLLLAVLTGAALFSVRASEYMENRYLLVKWAFVAAGVLNAAVFALRQRRHPDLLDTGHAKLAGGVSLLCWLGALACGRWIAFA